MALRLQTLGPADFPYMVLLVILTVASWVDSSPLYSLEGVEALPSGDVWPVYFRFKRTPDEEASQVHLPGKLADFDSTQQDVDEIELDNAEEPSERFDSKEFDLNEEQTKQKPTNKQQKYSNFKHSSGNKVSLEPRYVASNESINEKQRADGSRSSKPSIPSKKESKLSSNYSDSTFKADTFDSTSSNKQMLENKIAKQELELVQEPLNSTMIEDTDIVRLNDTHVMSDQPVEEDIDVPHNATDLFDSDSSDFFPNNTDAANDNNNSTTNADGRTMPNSEGMDFLLISGIILGTAILLGIAAGGGFAVYRHRIWNKPQTLSDKCSNADSSGYIDDSTLRENSEEMYSLDNDSFLNSLEAMTIQNYWTDNVKHTKL